MAELLGISVCYASDKVEWLHQMQVEAGTTIGEAIERSGVLAAFPDINLTTQPVGIYAKKKTLDTVLRERDRIEIYRPLVADPKESRRKRAAKKERSATDPAADGA
ncbi:RnfH family protein [Massilia sp. CFBP9026]|uniref:RnfH family protein n=1 Tax=Massilia sp. CFBP9026 TaxID=3096536 RepID=UPI002A6A24B7|nr:RnfH family protein [Massilia sp. CFBP9026]MDY0961007.1 RnfH family protein [Massilia sp. CFBP9026]